VIVKPMPSWFTLLWDVLDWLGDRRRGPSLTFSSQLRASVVSGELPGFMERARVTRARLASTGFRLVAERTFGFEELPVFSILPVQFWEKLASSVRTPFSPSVALLASRNGRAATE
jgi:hypothetical protein